MTRQPISYPTMSRRQMLALFPAALACPKPGLAATPKEIMWEDLIPPGVAYAEIIAEGEMDEASDFWRPVYDENAVKLNASLDGAYIRMPGFIIPMEVTSKGVVDFMLVPYVGACIHVPPPPANQLVMVHARDPWPDDRLWEAVWVIGTLLTQLQSTTLGQIGYVLTADRMEIYEW